MTGITSQKGSQPIPNGIAPPIPCFRQRPTLPPPPPTYIRPPSSRSPSSPPCQLPLHNPASNAAPAGDRCPAAGRQRRGAQVAHVAAGEHFHRVPALPRRRRRRRRRRRDQGRVRGGVPVQPLPVRQVLRPGRRVPAVGVRGGGAARRAPAWRQDHRRLGRDRLRVLPQSRHTRWKEVRRGGERRRRAGGGRERAVAGAAGGRPGLARRPVVGARLRAARGAAGGRGRGQGGGLLRRRRRVAGDQGAQEERRCRLREPEPLAKRNWIGPTFAANGLD